MMPPGNENVRQSELGQAGPGLSPSRSLSWTSTDDSSIKTALTKEEAASSFCLFAPRPVESFLVAKVTVSIGERRFCGDIDRVVPVTRPLHVQLQVGPSSGT